MAWYHRHKGLAGALAGGALGSIVPVVGNVIGAIVGALAGPSLIPDEHEDEDEPLEGEEELASGGERQAASEQPMTDELNIGTAQLTDELNAIRAEVERYSQMAFTSGAKCEALSARVAELEAALRDIFDPSDIHGWQMSGETRDSIGDIARAALNAEGKK